MKDILVEVCCGSADDVLEACKAGSTRVELNSCLFHGGLTPSVGTLITTRKELEKLENGSKMQIITMIRPREGGFCYTDVEFETAKADARMLLDNGADGIVFGFLHEDGTIDVERTKEMVQLAGDKTTVFHRAIDVVPDWKAALDVLVELGVTRVLTSGQEPSALLGASTIKEMIEYAAGRIQILPGAGINLKTMGRVISESNCTEIHLAAHKTMYDQSTTNNSKIFFGGALYPPEDRFNIIDCSYIGAVCANAKSGC